MAAQRPEPLLSAEEVAEYLGVPKATLYAWRYRSEGPPALRIGRYLRCRPEDVSDWVAMQGEEGIGRCER